MRRHVVVRATFAALVVATVVGAAGRTATQARADTSFGTFALSASATGVEASEDRADAVAHPEGQGAVPWTAASLSAGPVAYGLSTVAWPGAIAGNAGKLLLVAAPSQVGGVPIPDAVRQAVLGNAGSLDFPIRAEAQNGSTPDATYGLPGTTLKAHADESRVESIANVNGADQPGTATYGNMSARSALKLADVATSEASSLVQDVALAAGAVKIGSVRSNAKAVTDGTKATAEGATVVSDLEIGGQKAYVDATGVHAGDQGQPVNAVAEQLLGSTLDKFGIDVFLSEPRKELEGAKGNFDAGSLIISWTPPGSDQAPTLVWTLGGARVAVDAEPGFDIAGVGDVDSGGFGDLGSEAALPADTSGLGDLGASAGPVGALAGTGSPTPRASTPSGSNGDLGTANLTPIASVFDGNPASWVLGALVAAVLVGALAKRLAGDLVDAPVTSCPLDPGARP